MRLLGLLFFFYSSISFHSLKPEKWVFIFLQIHVLQSLQKSPTKSHEDIAAEIHAKAAALLSKVNYYT